MFLKSSLPPKAGFKLRSKSRLEQSIDIFLVSGFLLVMVSVFLQSPMNHHPAHAAGGSVTSSFPSPTESPIAPPPEDPTTLFSVIQPYLREPIPSATPEPIQSPISSPAPPEPTPTPTPETTEQPESNREPASQGFIVPIRYQSISQGIIPWVHYGIDFVADTGTEVHASANGRVLSAETSGWNGGFGKNVLIRHSGEITTRYAHLSRISVSTGQTVNQGQPIGLVGNTGRSTGPHLHFETRKNGKVINPLR